MRLYSFKKLLVTSFVVGFDTLFSAQADARPRLLARIFGWRPNTTTYTYTADSGNVVTQEVEGERRSFSYEPTYEPTLEPMPRGDRAPARAPWDLPKSDPRRYQ